MAEDAKVCTSSAATAWGQVATGVAVVILAVGCGGPSVSPTFPSPDRLERYEAVAFPELEPMPEVPAEWALDVVPPTVNASSERVDDALTRDAAPHIERAAPGAVPDANLRCVAEVLARSRARGEELSPHVRRWVEARCGAEWGRASLMYFTGERRVESGELGELIPQVEPPRRERRSDAASAVRWAVAQAEHDGAHVYVVAYMQPRLQLEPVAMVPGGDGLVAVSGRVPAQVESISGGVTQGRFGASECLLDDEVELPAFRLLCPTEQSDDQGWVSIFVRERGRLLAEHTASLFVSPDGSLPVDMRLDRGALEGVVNASEIDEVAVVEAINVLRARLDLRPVRFDAAQARAMSRVQGAYWTAWSEDDLRTVDMLVLGMMAGWQVEVPIVDGGFLSGAGARPEDLTTLVALELMRPEFRMQALDPDMDIAAFAFSEAARNLFMLTAYYASLEDADHEAATAQVYALLDARRAAAGHGPAPRMPEDVQRILLRHAENVHVRDRNPNHQMTAVLELLSPRYHRLQGWMLYSQSLDEVRFPATFIQGSGYEVALGVAAWRGRRDAWSAWVTMVAVDNLPRRAEAGDLHEAFLAEGWVPVYGAAPSVGTPVRDDASASPMGAVGAGAPSGDATAFPGRVGVAR